MKKAKKLVALLLAIAMFATVLIGCTDNGEKDDKGTKGESSVSKTEGTSGDAPELASTYPEFEQHREIEITWFEQGWTGPEADLDFVAPEIEARTNLKLKYEAMIVPTEADYTQKLNLMVAANEVPDVFFGGIDAYTREIYGKLGSTGSLWDFSEIIKDYPELYKLVEPELNLYGLEDGANFFVPTQTGRGYEVINEPPHGFFIRQDFLDKLNMEYPTTPDELYEYLKRATSELEINGEPVRGILFGENIGGLNHLLEMYFPLIGDRETYGLPFDVEDDYKIKNYEYTNSPEMMKGAKFVNKLVTEGLVDSEALTIKNAQFQEKGSSGLYAAMAASWWDMNVFSDNAKSEVEDIFWVCPPPIYETEEIRESRNRPWSNWVGCYSSLIVNKDIDEDTLRHLLAVMDYMCTEEGQLLVQAGVEDLSFQWDDEGKYEYTPEFIEDTNDLDWNKAAAYGVFYYAQLVNNTPAVAELQATPPALLREDNYQGWLNQQIHRDAYDSDMELTLDYYFLPGEVQTELFQPIRDQKIEFFGRIVAAKSEAEIEDIVNEWGATCDSMGIDKILAERAAIMDDLKKDLG